MDSSFSYEISSAPVVTEATCRFCGKALRESFVDLGMSPLCNTYIAPQQLCGMEAFYPLHALVCTNCWLVQLQEFVAPADIFSEYSYFSSYSDTWVEHARQYTERMIERFGISSSSLVMEIASNDGYLLQHFVTKDVPVLGIEPAINIARVAIERGVPTEIRFFDSGCAQQIAQRHGKSDLLIGNNVLAHVSDLNDFVGGMKALLKSDGIITMEFPHLFRLMQGNQFDTIYHEHFSYFSFTTVSKVFAHHGLVLFDVEELPTHGGSLRIYGRHGDDNSKPLTERASYLLTREHELGVKRLETYRGFGAQVARTKRKLLDLLIGLKRNGKSIAGYGAPGKGNTLLNYCGIRTDFLDFTVDRTPYKQGKFTPGTHIPILHPDHIAEARPDYILILPWNWLDEILERLAYTREWGARFIVPIPEVRVI